MTNIGCAIAQRLTSALSGLGLPHDQVSKIVYDECRAIASELEKGDWLEMPDGDTFSMTLKVRQPEPLTDAECEAAWDRHVNNQL